ncbi:MAG: hypothetical protein ABSC63_04905 [Candidatus Binataceae bacterium]
MAAAMVALALVISTGVRAFAADLSATPGNTLNVTGAAASVLPQTPAGGTSAENSWLSGFHVSGFLSQTFAMWQNPEGLRSFTTSRNSLATSRTWLQVDENLRLNENNNLFMREWFVYEPPYAFEATRSWCGASRWRFAWATWSIRRTRPGPSASPTSSSRAFRSG